MRSFIAINLPDTVKADIGDIVERLCHAGPPARWVSSENLHVTIKFLDEIDDRQVRPIVGAITMAAGRHHPFELRLGGFGFFPNERKARVLWVGIETGGDPLKALAQSIDHEVTGLGFPPEKRRFSGHITLARIRTPGPIGRLARAAAHIGYHSPSIPVSRIDLMRSVLSPRGATYSVVDSVFLKR